MNHIRHAGWLVLFWNGGNTGLNLVLSSAGGTGERHSGQAYDVVGERVEFAIGGRRNQMPNLNRSRSAASLWESRGSSPFLRPPTRELLIVGSGAG